MQITTRQGLQAPENAPQVLCSAEELLNSMRRNSVSNVNLPDTASKPFSHLGSGYNLRKQSRLSAKHLVFVLGVDEKSLTPTTSTRAKKLMKDNQAKPVWNKFNQFGIKMMVETRKETPRVVLGCDFGTKFEGYSVISGKENTLNVMWKLPDKKKLVKKLEERRTLRRARRFRNCRRREARFDNRERKEFIAPSQLQVVNSRLKCINEFFNCYPIHKAAIEDVKFNHRDNRWGRNFSTVEVGKKKIFDNIITRIGTENLIMFSGMDTQVFREKNNLRKSSDKSSKNFYSHCVDSFVIANELSQAMPNKNLIYVDNSYRAVRRKLHDTQPAEGGIRANFSTGSFKGIRKGTMCEYGQIVGGTKDQAWYQDFEMRGNRKIYQKGKMLKKIGWLSHKYKSEAIAG